MMTLHARIAAAPHLSSARGSEVVAAIKTRLAERFGVTHATVEIEPGDGA